MNDLINSIATRDTQNLIDFEAMYYAIREKEKRVYTDEQVRSLPDIAPGHLHFNEWQIRKRSADKFMAYLKKKQKPLTVLEVGCGNGWLTAKIAAIPNVEVIGLDINKTEIDQASRVFRTANLNFLYESFKPNTFDGVKFDIVVFAASLPYFSSLKSTLQLALNLLNPGGEIHLLDTHFYKNDAVAAAQERCYNYYNALGYPGMSDYYFHHTIDELKHFKYRVLLNPNALFNRLRKKNPFYWITLKQ